MNLPQGTARKSFVDAPTVQVQQLDLADGRRVVVKRYRFPELSQRLRGMLRHTWLGTPKPEREAADLLRLRRHGVAAAEPLAWEVERDALGFVRDGYLMTPFLCEGRTLLDALRERAALPEPFWTGLGESVGRIHAAGCCYRTLRARNLLVDPADPRRFFWIDPAKCRWRPAPLADGFRAADLMAFFLPLAERSLLAPEGWPWFRCGYRHFEGLAAPAALDALLARRLRRRLRADLRRESVRHAADGASR